MYSIVCAFYDSEHKSPVFVLSGWVVSSHLHHMVSSFYLTGVLFGWTFFFLTAYLTWYVLKGLEEVTNLVPKVRRCFMIAQSFALTFILSRSIYATLRLSEVVEIREESGRESWQVAYCTATGTVESGLLTLAYAYYAWFWYIRLHISFDNAASFWRISHRAQLLSKCWFAYMHIGPFIGVALVLMKPMVIVKVQKDVYSCIPSGNQLLLMLLFYVVGTLLYIVFAAYLCYAFVSRLKLVFTKSSARMDVNEQFALRKVVVIAVSSAICSMTLVLIYSLTFAYAFAQFDMLLNTMFIACYFHFGKPIYDRVFCLCERYDERLNRCCGIDSDESLKSADTAIDPLPAALNRNRVGSVTLSPPPTK